MVDYKTLEQEIDELWEKRNMKVKTVKLRRIGLNTWEWKIIANDKK